MANEHTPTDALLHCPFCSSDARNDAHADDCYFVLHRKLSEQPEADLSMQLEVLAAWNRRAQPAQAADSVLEDAARLDWLALAGPTSICVVVDRRHDGEVEVSTDDVTGYGKTLREALDAARKQGVNHD